MPIISVKFIEDFFTEEQQAALIPARTDAFCKATIEAARPVRSRISRLRSAAIRAGLPSRRSAEVTSR